MIRTCLTALRAAVNVFKHALRKKQLGKLAQTERTIQRIEYSLGVAYLAEPGPRHPAYGEFKVNAARAERYLEQQITKRTRLQRKLGLKT